eukprot:CFRG7453T1
MQSTTDPPRLVSDGGENYNNLSIDTSNKVSASQTFPTVSYSRNHTHAPAMHTNKASALAQPKCTNDNKRVSIAAAQPTGSRTPPLVALEHATNIQPSTPTGSPPVPYRQESSRSQTPTRSRSRPHTPKSSQTPGDWVWEGTDFETESGGDSETEITHEEKKFCHLSSSLPPVCSAIQRIVVYETKSVLLVVGREQSVYRLLRIDRTNAQQLTIIDDKTEYTGEEIDETIKRYSTDKTEGVRKKVTAFMILGFITFVEGYYMLLVTKRRKVGLLGGHSIYKVEDTVRVPISSVKVDKNPLETKYLSMFQAVDLSSNFYYCPTYDLTNPLQYNCVMYTKSQHDMDARCKEKTASRSYLSPSSIDSDANMEKSDIVSIQQTTRSHASAQTSTTYTEESTKNVMPTPTCEHDDMNPLYAPSTDVTLFPSSCHNPADIHKSPFPFPRTQMSPRLQPQKDVHVQTHLLTYAQVDRQAHLDTDIGVGVPVDPREIIHSLNFSGIDINNNTNTITCTDIHSPTHSHSSTSKNIAPHTPTHSFLPALPLEAQADSYTEAYTDSDIRTVTGAENTFSPLSTPYTRPSSAPPFSGKLRSDSNKQTLHESNNKRQPEFVKRVFSVKGEFNKFNVASFLVKCGDILSIAPSDLYIHSVKNRRGIYIAVDLSIKALDALDKCSQENLDALGIVGVSALPQSTPSLPQYEPPPFTGMFAWNHFLLEKMLPNCHRAWITPLIHGYISQAKINIMGRLVYLLLIARRSRHFAGARFLKRGANEEGHVANHVESEQIVWDASTSCHDNGRYTSFVQMRGSIPAYWSQTDREMSSKYAPKPGITVDRVDPFAVAAAVHFDSLRRRFGNPTIVLNLVKQKEIKPRESKLFKEFNSIIQYLNQFVPKRDKIIYIPFDMARCAKSKQENVIDELGLIAKRCLAITGFFHSGPSLSAPPDCIGGRNYGEDVIGRKQLGVLRVNCIDCLDRTNAACFMIGREALANQLYVLGFIPNTQLSFTSDCVRVFEKMYEEHGDAIATQYGGSNLVNTMETYRKASRSRLRDKAAAAQRYLSNAFNDEHKQGAINLFLGKFQPRLHLSSLIITNPTPMTDYELHYEPPTLSWRFPRRSYTRWWSDMRGLSHCMVYCIDNKPPPDNFYRDIADSEMEVNGALQIVKRRREITHLNNNGHYKITAQTLTVFTEMFEYCEYFPFPGYAFRMLSTVHRDAEHDHSPFRARDRQKLQSSSSGGSQHSHKADGTPRFLLPSQRFRYRQSSWYSADEDDALSVGGNENRHLSVAESDREGLSPQASRLDVDKMPLSKFVNTYHVPSHYDGNGGSGWDTQSHNAFRPAISTDQSGLRQALTFLDMAQDIPKPGSHSNVNHSLPDDHTYTREWEDSHTQQLRSRLSSAVPSFGNDPLDDAFNEYATIVTGFDQAGVDRGQNVEAVKKHQNEYNYGRQNKTSNSFIDIQDKRLLIYDSSEDVHTETDVNESFDVDNRDEDVMPVKLSSCESENRLEFVMDVDIADEYTPLQCDEMMYKATALPINLIDNVDMAAQMFEVNEESLGLYQEHCNVYVAGF